MKDEKVFIVILNYLCWKDTIECINSILVQRNIKFEIVIVDNDSPDNSYSKLLETFDIHDNIHIIKSRENLGFARGNNMGISYIKRKFGIVNILLLNADTILVDNEYLYKLSQIAIDQDVGAVGTKIIGSDKINQNPVDKRVTLRLLLKEYLIAVIRMYKPAKIKRIVKKDVLATDNEKAVSFYRKGNDFFLHGSAILLTKNYFNSYSKLYPKTFLYTEEHILAMLLSKENLQFVYDPSIGLYHKEDASSTASFNNSGKIKGRFAEQSIREAIKVYFMDSGKLKRLLNKD